MTVEGPITRDNMSRVLMIWVLSYWSKGVDNIAFSAEISHAKIIFTTTINQPDAQTNHFTYNEQQTKLGPQMQVVYETLM